MKLLPLIFISSLLLTACLGDSDNNDDEATISANGGLVTTSSTASVDETFDGLDKALVDNPDVFVVARVDHAANAQTVDMQLRPTRLVIFGNPGLGTPLMQSSQTTGIDLPQKLLVWEDANGQVFATYNGVNYLVSRHDIAGVEDTVEQIAAALRNLAEGATGVPVDSEEANADGDVDTRQGLVITKSAFDVDETFSRLEQAVGDNPALTIMARVDHAANAETVDLQLRPTRLLIFGNPTLGTPLIRTSQTIGIDLPQKLLVYEDADGMVFVAYNDPFYLAQRHSIQGQDDILNQISTALGGLVGGATSASETP